MTPYEGQPLAVLVTIVEADGALRHLIVDGGPAMLLSEREGGGLVLEAVGTVRDLSTPAPTARLGDEEEPRVYLAGPYRAQPIRLRRAEMTVWARLRAGLLAPTEWLTVGPSDPRRSVTAKVQGAAASALWAAVERRRDRHLWQDADAARRRDFQTEVGIATMLAVSALLADGDGAGIVWRGTVVGVRLTAQVGEGAVWLSLDAEGAG
jgi:hypothetical protein